MGTPETVAEYSTPLAAGPKESSISKATSVAFSVTRMPFTCHTSCRTLVGAEQEVHHLPPLASSAYPSTATSNQMRRIRAVVPLPRGPRVPSLPLVGLCQLRVQQHQKAIEGCGDAAAMATEHPRVLNAIPEQHTLLLPCLCLGPCKR